MSVQKTKQTRLQGMKDEIDHYFRLVRGTKRSLNKAQSEQLSETVNNLRAEYGEVARDYIALGDLILAY